VRKVTFEQVASDEKNVEFQPSDSFLLSYREFIAYFANQEVITSHNLVIAAHFTYGWMPTKLRFRFQSQNPEEELLAAAAILNNVKSGRLVEAKQLRLLRDLINNSLAGASKFLHFVNPHLFAIWDSNVYRYINGEDPYHYQLNRVENYFAFLENCNEITLDDRFKQVHISINGKVGYDVSPLRAVELVMFMSSSNSRREV
jgi:hypothetical protein